MSEELWNKHTPGDPMPCKCGDSVVEVRLRNGFEVTDLAKLRNWDKIDYSPRSETTDWRFVERKGEDVIQRCAECDCEGGSSECNWIKSGPSDPYDDIEWDDDDTAIVVLKKPGKPWWVRDDDLVRFGRDTVFIRAGDRSAVWSIYFAFQIKRRPVLTPAVPQVLEMLAVATDDDADAIRRSARRANIEMPKGN